MMHAGKTLEDSIVHDVLEFFRLPWGQVSGCAKDLMRQMLRKDPNQRPLAQQLLQHPWFTLEDPGLDQPLDGVMHLLSVVGSHLCSHVLQSCILHALLLAFNSLLSSPPQLVSCIFATSNTKMSLHGTLAANMGSFPSL